MFLQFPRKIRNLFKLVPLRLPLRLLQYLKPSQKKLPKLKRNLNQKRKRLHQNPKTPKPQNPRREKLVD